MKKEKTFKISLGQPKWNAQSLRQTAASKQSKTSRRKTGSSVKYEVAEEDDIDQVLQETSRLGRPRLGSPSEMMVVIRESSNLRATLDEILDISDNVGDLVNASTWPQQFTGAMAVNGDYDSDSGEWGEPTVKHYVIHFLTIFWKIVIATIPPAHYGQGWPASVVALFYIFFLTAIIGDLASQLGCTIGIRDELTAITFVALGTSLPDLFASRLAAVKEETADAAIGHANGAVAVNVFLGLGLSWSVAAIYQSSHGGVLHVPPGSLTFSFTIFILFAFVGIAAVMLRRLAPIYGELGGPTIPKWLTVILFISLWIIYVLLSALDSYCLIDTF